MKAISLTQPWATLVVIGAKRFETRSWRTRYRGPLLIHAAKGFPKSAQAMCQAEQFRLALWAAGCDLAPLLTGMLLGTGDVTDCRKIGQQDRPSEPELSFGDYTPGRFAWRLENPRLLPKHIAYVGALGVFNVPDEVLS